MPVPPGFGIAGRDDDQVPKTGPHDVIASWADVLLVAAHLADVVGIVGARPRRRVLAKDG